MTNHSAFMTICLPVLLLCSAPLSSPAQEPTAEEEIREAVAAYVEAFNSHDAKSLAALWSPEAVYTSRTSGQQVVGRTAMEQEFTVLFGENEGMRLEATTVSVQLISPNIAVEHGTARILQKEGELEQSTYTAVYMKRDGQWLLDRVTEDDVPIIKSHQKQLKDLAWMIGNWVDEDDNARIQTECSWTRNNNFITRSFTVTIRDRVDMAGMQIIGWDPAAEKIRSWTFDSDGGFADGTWTQKGNRWFVQKTGTTADGRKVSAVNVIQYVDENTLTLQSVSRSVDGEILPNIDEVRVIRTAGE